MYDLAIIGAGPAGATFARLAGKKYKILLIDRRQMAGCGAAHTAESSDPTASSEKTGPSSTVFSADPSGKCCGGLLAPDAQRMLARFGLGLPRRVLVEPQLFVVQAIDIPRNRKRFYQRFYINMDRSAFERWLVDMAVEHVECRFGCRFRSFVKESDGFRIILSQDGRQVTEKARIVVAADGATSTVRRQWEGRPASSTHYAAVQEYVEVEGVPPYYSALFDPDLTDYYCWTVPKGRCLLIGGAFRPETARADFLRFQERLRHLGFRWGKSIRCEAALLRRPRRLAHLSPGRQGVALLGEAGGWISPSSAEGISYAFRTALALHQALLPGIEGFERRYRRCLRPLLWNIFFKNLKARMIFHPVLRSLALRSGWRSVRVNEEEWKDGASEDEPGLPKCDVSRISASGRLISPSQTSRSP